MRPIKWRPLTVSTSALRLTLAVALALLFLECKDDEGDWASADSRGTVSSYQEYLRDHTQGKYANDAKPRLSLLAKGAKVVIECPDTLKSQPRPDKIHYPGEWSFTIKFLEVSGWRASISYKRMQIFARDGTIWGNKYSVPMSKIVVLEPYGVGEWSDWVGEGIPGRDNGSKMVLEFSGANNEMKSIDLEKTIILVE
jgi:hypothetical protein